MIPEFNNEPMFAAWPFWLLELTPDASDANINQAAQKLEGQLKLQIPGANIFKSPIGEHDRDDFKIREAKAILLDPAKRLVSEFWYVEPQSTMSLVPLHHSGSDDDAAVWKKRLGV